MAVATGCTVEKLANEDWAKCCLVVDKDDNGVLFNISLFDELTVVSSLSGVGFFVIDVSITVLVVVIQANLGRGRFITGLRDIELGLVAVIVVVVVGVEGLGAFDKSASLDDETSLEL